MSEPPRPYEHQDAERKSDEALRSEARTYLAATPALQLVAELLARLRLLDLPWWKPEMLRERWTATERMRWYRARPDLRQEITTSLTGLAPKAARKKTPDFQSSLLDAVVDETDISPKTFEEAFDPCDLVVYGPVEAFWHAFIEKMPWDKNTAVHQELVAWLFDALLANRSAIDGMVRKPILTPWDARTSIDGRVWHTKMPLDIRVAIDDARFKKEHEHPSDPFHADSDLAIAVASTIATSIPLKDLAPVFATAARAMGFAPPNKSGPQPEPKKADNASTPEVATAAPAASASAPPPAAAPAATASASSAPAAATTSASNPPPATTTSASNPPPAVTTSASTPPGAASRVLPPPLPAAPRRDSSPGGKKDKDKDKSDPKASSASRPSSPDLVNGRPSSPDMTIGSSPDLVGSLFDDAEDVVFDSTRPEERTNPRLTLGSITNENEEPGTQPKRDSRF